MKGRFVRLGAVDWLALAAAPTFGLMALLTAMPGDDHVTLMCSQAGYSSAFSGMAPMYLLMAAFHLVPWFRLTRAS